MKLWLQYCHCVLPEFIYINDYLKWPKKYGNKIHRNHAGIGSTCGCKLEIFCLNYIIDICNRKYIKFENKNTFFVLFFTSKYTFLMTKAAYICILWTGDPLVFCLSKIMLPSNVTVTHMDPLNPFVKKWHHRFRGINISIFDFKNKCCMNITITYRCI